MLIKYASGGQVSHTEMSGMQSASVAIEAAHQLAGALAQVCATGVVGDEGDEEDEVEDKGREGRRWTDRMRRARRSEEDEEDLLNQ